MVILVILLLFLFLLSDHVFHIWSWVSVVFHTFYPTFFCQHDLFEWQLHYVSDMKLAFICQVCFKMCLKASFFFFFTSVTLQELLSWVRKCAIWYCRDRVSSCNIYAVQQDTLSFFFNDWGYSSHMLARHVSDLIGPSSGAFHKLYLQIWYVL